MARTRATPFAYGAKGGDDIRHTHRGEGLPGRGEVSAEGPAIPGSALRHLDAAQRYLSRFGEVEGWCSHSAALAMMELISCQAQLGIPGGIAEIGVHHGKSFIALAIAARPEDPLFAIDLFEMQELNLDGSGAGNREQFLRHLATFAPDRRPRLIAGSSDKLWDRLEALGLTGLRFLSIDGGHTAALTRNDLRLAETVLHRDGIAVLDDLLNPHWLGVVTGLFDYLREGALRPLAVVPNKLILCRQECRDRYRRFLRHALADALQREAVEFANGTVDVYGEVPPTDLRLGPPAAQAPDPRLQEIAALRAELRALRASTSWRVTAPLRAAKLMLHRWRR